MVSPGISKKPLLLFKLFLDQGLKRLAGKIIDFKGESFIASVLDWATIDRSIPYPPGLTQTSDALITLQDTENDIRELFNNVTPLRRLGQIIFENENDPLTPMSDPIYTGEIDTGVELPTGQATIPLRDVTGAWLDRKIPNLLIRDNFPNLPDFIELGFIPIIAGVCQSYSALGIEPQGVIKCWECDTTLHRYVVARHSCHSVTTVYRKLTKLHSLFKPVSPTEYSIIEEDKDINGITYTMTYIQFHVAQPYATEIHADVAGMNFKYDFQSGHGVNVASPVRNPVDIGVNIIYYLLEDEVNILRFSSQDFIDTAQRCDDKDYLADGAITQSDSAGVVLSRLFGDFGIDFFQTNHGLIKVHQYDPELDANDTVLINEGFVGRQSFTPSIQKKIYNRFRYRYFHQNALLSEYTKFSHTGQWGREETIDYIPDQEELGATGENPILELELDLHFVRDSNIAFNVIKRRIGYFTLRSYDTEFELPLPEFIDLDLTQLLSVSHFAGVAKDGWTDKVMKTYRLTQNLKTWRVTVGAVIIAHISDADLSHNGGSPAHDPQIIYPQLALAVNADYLGYPNADPQAMLSDTYPAAPSSTSDDEGTIPSSFSFTSTGGSTRSVPTSRLSFTNVRFQEDRTTSPRSISAYVPGFPTNTTEMYAGTLNPDQRPTGLVDSDIHKVMFYSTDFDHLYWWVGKSESGTPSGWRAIELTAGNIELRWDSPTLPGWHKCDGATVFQSDYKGDVAEVTLPNVIPDAADLLAVGSSPQHTATPSLTEQSTVPSCLGSSGIVIGISVLVPWMRL